MKNLVKLVTREAPLLAVEFWYQGMVDQLAMFFDTTKFENVFVFKNGVFERYVEDRFLHQFPEYVSNWVEKNEKQIELAINYQKEAIVLSNKLLKQTYESKDLLIKDLFDFCSQWKLGFAGLVITYLIPLWQESYEKQGVSLFSEEVLEKSKKLRHDVESFFGDGVQVIDYLLMQLSELTGVSEKQLRLSTSNEIKQDINILGQTRENGFYFVDNKVMSELAANTYFSEHGLQMIQDNVEETVKGRSANPGTVKGVVKVVFHKDQLSKVNDGDILVAPMTTPWYLPAVKKAAGIVTDEGGITCHAAIVSRELNKPCLVGTKNGTTVLKDGMMVELDATKGDVKILS